MGRIERRLWLVVDRAAEAAAVHEFQSAEGQSIMFANLVHLHDIGMLDVRFGQHFGAKARYCFRAGDFPQQNHLQRDLPIECQVPGKIDDPHAAAPKLAL